MTEREYYDRGNVTLPVVNTAFVFCSHIDQVDIAIFPEELNNPATPYEKGKCQVLCTTCLWQQ